MNGEDIQCTKCGTDRPGDRFHGMCLHCLVAWFSTGIEEMKNQIAVMEEERAYRETVQQDASWHG